MTSKVALFCLFVFCAAILDARFYFIHIPKTAGTTFRLMLEMQLSKDEIYPYRNYMRANRVVRERLVSGHFPYWFCRQLDPHFKEAFKVTILRDPVERYLSFLRAKKKRGGFSDLESVMRQRRPSGKGLHFDLIDNALCRNLAADSLLEGEDLLESAKQALQEFDCVLFFDRFTQDVVDLFRRLGIDLDEKDVPKMNFTEKESVSDPLLEEVKELNQWDIKLYQYAKTHLPKKDTRYALRTQSFDRVLAKANAIDYSFDFPLNGKGWSYRENLTHAGPYSTYRWVMDRPADIYFSLEKGSDYDLYFTAQPLTDEVFPRVKVNGKEIELLKMNEELFCQYHGEIPEEYITEGSTEISFYSSKSFFYQDVYPSQKQRKDPPFSFALNRILISRKR